MPRQEKFSEWNPVDSYRGTIATPYGNCLMIVPGVFTEHFREEGKIRLFEISSADVRGFVRGEPVGRFSLFSELVASNCTSVCAKISAENRTISLSITKLVCSEVELSVELILDGVACRWFIKYGVATPISWSNDEKNMVDDLISAGWLPEGCVDENGCLVLDCESCTKVIAGCQVDIYDAIVETYAGR